MTAILVIVGFGRFPTGEGFWPFLLGDSENLGPLLFDQRGEGIFILLGQKLDHDGATIVPVIRVERSSPAVHSAEDVITQNSY